MRLVAVVVWLSACSFAPATQSDAAPGTSQDDARGHDAAIDARPDARPDAPRDAFTWHQLEVLTVPCSGTTVTSTTVLTSTGTYQLEASGECTTNTANASHGDAEYFGYNVGQFSDVSGSIDVGISIGNATPGATKLPRWGTYTATHIYDVPWTGTGATISANFWDSNYPNNDGSISVAIQIFD